MSCRPIGWCVDPAGCPAGISTVRLELGHGRAATSLDDGTSHWLLARCSVLKVRPLRRAETQKAAGRAGGHPAATSSSRLSLGGFLPLFGCHDQAFDQIGRPFGGF